MERCQFHEHIRMVVIVKLHKKPQEKCQFSGERILWQSFHQPHGCF